MHERPIPPARRPAESSRPKGPRRRESSPGLEDEHTGLPALYTKDHRPVSPLPLIAERVGLSPEHLASLLRQGIIPGVKLSRIYFVNLDDAEAYVHSPKNKGGRGRITFRSHGSAYQNHRIA